MLGGMSSRNNDLFDPVDCYFDINDRNRTAISTGAIEVLSLKPLETTMFQQITRSLHTSNIWKGKYSGKKIKPVPPEHQT